MSTEDNDTEIICVDCKQPFVFTAGEVEFFRNTFGADFHPPKRCKACRERRKPGKVQAFANGAPGDGRSSTVQPAVVAVAPKRQRSR